VGALADESSAIRANTILGQRLKAKETLRRWPVLGLRIPIHAHRPLDLWLLVVSTQAPANPMPEWHADWYRYMIRKT
jgi:hypothetical protein